jgi:hypothetical protein
MSKRFIATIALFASISSFAQKDTLSAKEILHRTIAACGGDTWQKPQSLILNGDAIFTPYGSTDTTKKISFDRYVMFREYPTENDAAHKANGKVRFDAKYGDSVFMQLVFDGKESKSQLSAKAKPYEKHFSWSNNFGFGIIRFADNDSFKVTRLTDDQVEGQNCYIIQIIDPKKMVTVFGIDKNSYYIRMLSFVTEVGFHQRIYSDFTRRDWVVHKPIKTEDGRKSFSSEKFFFVQPKRLRIYFDGLKWMDIHWRYFVVNEKIGEDVFQ